MLKINILISDFVSILNSVCMCTYFRSKQLIKGALLENDFLKNLEPGQMRDIIDCMYSRVCVKGSYLIREGDTGKLNSNNNSNFLLAKH